MVARGAVIEAERLLGAVEKTYGTELAEADRKEMLKMKARMAVAKGAGDEEARILEEIVAIDPLDGSSNIDVNVSIGTIFSIYKRKTKPGTKLTKKDFLQKGTEQVAAGYVLYGSSTMLVYTTGKGVNGFTYETTLGEYVLSHPQMKCPSDGKIYSINEAGLQQYSDPTIERYLTQCKKDGFTARYIGSLVADIHRNMIKGGIFLYPATSKYPNGKLRLLFECNALALIVEQAGGLASNGSKRILEMEPNGLHQTTPMYIGSKQLVKSLLRQSKKK
jgi:fructose-1,6-bisphosphatase I